MGCFLSAPLSRRSAFACVPTASDAVETDSHGFARTQEALEVRLQSLQAKSAGADPLSASSHTVHTVTTHQAAPPFSTYASPTLGYSYGRP